MNTKDKHSILALKRWFELLWNAQIHHIKPQYLHGWLYADEMWAYVHVQTFVILMQEICATVKFIALAYLCHIVNFELTVWV